MSRKRPVIGMTLLTAMLVAAGVRSDAQQAREQPTLRRFTYEQVHMAVPVRIVFYAPNEATANPAADAAFARIAALNTALSDYDPQSELSRLSRSSGSGQVVPLSPDLFRVLSTAQALSARTQGAFDVSVGPYVQLWRRARRQKQLPSPQRLAEAKAAVGYEFIRLDAARRTAKLERPGMRLDLGGIAKGYAADEMLAVLRRSGIERALVAVAGDVACGESPPDAKSWRVALAPPSANAETDAYLELTNAAVSTSGDAHQFVEIDGRRYSHIVDPRTGRALERSSAVSVIAPNGMTADSLATAVSVLGPEAGLKLVEETPGCSARFQHVEGKTLQSFESKGFAEQLAPKSEPQ